MSRFPHSASASAATLSPPRLETCHYPDDEPVGVLMGPSPSQLKALLAVPLGLGTQASSTGKGKSKNKTKKSLVREGQVVSKIFDGFGSRPWPRNGLSLEQGITMEFITVYPASINSSSTNGAITYFGRSFAASDYSGATTALTLFDQYRFEQVEVWIDCVAPNAVANMPVVYSCVDLDDFNVSTSIGQIADHVGATVATFPAGHYHKWKPHMATAAYSGAFTSYSNAPAEWIDANSPNVQHYGFKSAMLSSGTTIVYGDVTVRSVISFRSPSIA